MHTQLSLVKTMALACGAALLTMGVVLALIGAPGAVQAAPSASIQSMIDAAPNGGTVNIPSGTYTESLTVNKTLTLTSVSSTTTIIQAVSGQRVLTVTSGHNLRLENLTLTGGHPASAVGGGVYAIDGNLRIVSCRIANNSAAYGGGVFQGGSGRVEVSDSRIELNATGTHGGGLYVNGNAALTNTLVLSNTADGHGGGLHVDVGSTTLSGGLFSNNRALGDNGGAVNVNRDIRIQGTHFISNSANDSGGALLQWNAGYTVTVANAQFERNTAKNKGGGAFIASTLIISHSTFMTNTVDSGNTNNTYGGGVSAGNAVQVISSTFRANEAKCTSCSFMRGGGLYMDSTQPLTVERSRFEKNYAWSGGGLYGSNVVIRSTTFLNNRAGYGAGVSASEATIQSSDFLNNQVVNRGGALGAGLRLTLSSTRFISNTSGAPGGALQAGGSVTAENTLFVGNQSGWGAAVMSFENNATRVLRHVTIAHPTLGNNPAVQIVSGTLNLTNTIIASYTVGISQTDGILNADYDLFFTATPTQTSGGTVNWGPHNLNANPRFVNPATGDYHLATGSPAIDVGTNAGVTTDLDGVTRPQDNGYDIGAYEALPAFGLCYAQLVGSLATYTSTDAFAVQNAVNVAVPGDTVKVAGTCAGVQMYGGSTQTVYISKSLTLRGGYTTTNWITSNPIAYPTVLDAQQAGRVVYLTGGSSMSVTLDSLSVRNGSTTDIGGGILNNFSVLNVSNTVVSDNSADMGGGIRNEQGTVTVVNSVFANNSSSYWGGGIASYSGTLHVSSSTFTSNTSPHGGGIADNGDLTVTSSTFVSNSAQRGGGLFVYWGLISLTNSTLSGNRSTGNGASDGGGAIEYMFNPTPSAQARAPLTSDEHADGRADHEVAAVPQATVVAPSAIMLNCTVVSNTAVITNLSRSGIWLEGGTLDLGNSIIAHNGVTNNVQIDGGTFTSLGYNLTNSSAGMPFTATTDLINIDPLLGPLQDYGGSTWTHALLPGSAALDRIPYGVNGCGTTATVDQRGQPRPGLFTQLCDIGAYEVQGIYYHVYLPLVIK